MASRGSIWRSLSRNPAAAPAISRDATLWFVVEIALGMGGDLVQLKEYVDAKTVPRSGASRLVWFGSVPRLLARREARRHDWLRGRRRRFERRRWLAGENFSLADITAAAHLSTLDYLGDVPWDNHEPAKEWYARIKSRPSFRPLLADHIPGAPPPKHYADLDF